ncbi:2-acylglycerol O-acyltransferase 2-A [Blattella germanica]|nr:2-acylglycerol O-acyltransferase 2-A [Blattella germanica]
MEILGIKFAPLNTPLERRLQTLAACAWFITLGFGPTICIALTVYVILCTRFCIFGLLYVAWIFYDRDICNKGGRRSDWARRWAWWRYFRNYFPLELVKTADLDPTNTYMFCVFPHGVLSTGAFTSFATEANKFSELFPGLTPYLVTLAGHFITPIIRELSLSLGGCPSSAEAMGYVLSRPGNAIALIVGGASESLECHPGTYRIILKRRKGFIKLALMHGTPLVPVFSFGETDLYDQVSNPKGSLIRKAQEKFRKLTGIAPVLPIGRGLFQYSFGIIPLRRPVYTVGKNYNR